MASGSQANAAEIDRLALTLAKDPASKAFIPLAEEYGKAGMWAEAAGVLEDGLKFYPGFITAMVALGRAYDQLSQPTKAKAILEEAIKISPENLRAHRTLAKVYAAEGSTVSAIRSCDVILALNPLDQESLSLRASLGAAGAAITPAPVSPAGGPSPVPQSAEAPPTSSQMPVIEVTPKPALEATAASQALDASLTDIPAETSPPASTTLTADEASSEDRTDVETAKTSELQQAPSPAPSRNQLTANRLQHMLQSIQTRRRDRPAPETAATSSRS